MINLDNLLISNPNASVSKGEVCGVDFSKLLLEMNSESGFELSNQDISKMAELLGKSEPDLSSLPSKQVELLKQAVEKISAASEDSQKVVAGQEKTTSFDIQEIEQGQARLLSSVVLSSDLVSPANQMVLPVVEGRAPVQSVESEVPLEVGYVDIENVSVKTDVVAKVSPKELVANKSVQLTSYDNQNNAFKASGLNEEIHPNSNNKEQAVIQTTTAQKEVSSVTLANVDFKVTDTYLKSPSANAAIDYPALSSSDLVDKQPAPSKTLTIEQLNSRAVDPNHPSVPVVSISEGVKSTLSVTSNEHIAVSSQGVNVSVKNESPLVEQQVLKVNEQVNVATLSHVTKMASSSPEALTLLNLPEDNLKLDIVSNLKQEAAIEKMDAPRPEQVVKANPGKMESKLAELGLLVRQTALSSIKQITIQLKPVELGSVDVTVREVAGELMVKFVTEKPETAELLQRQESNLKQSLLNGDSAEMSYGDGQNQPKDMFTSNDFEKVDEQLVVETPKQAESVEQGRLRITV